MDQLYRYHDMRYEEGRVNVYLRTFPVVRTTRCGVWIQCASYDLKGDKFVLSNARKRFAYPTKKEALAAFIARKRSQYGILMGQAEWARAALTAAQKMQERGETEQGDGYI